MSIMSLLYGRRYPPLNLDFASLREIGAGSNRRCFVDPRQPDLLYKLSKPGYNAITKNEIAYFNFLKKHQIPFTHIPEFYGGFYCQHELGLVQSYIASDSSKEVLGLEQLLLRPDLLQILPPTELQQAYEELKHYLLTYNVLPADMFCHNVLLVKEKVSGKIKLYLIDGLGPHLLIPINVLLRKFGRRTILKQCHKFCLSVAATSGGRMQLEP